MTPARVQELVNGLSAADHYDFEERAAIMEYEAGLEHAEAERLAITEVLSKGRDGQRHLRQLQLIGA